MNSKIFRGISPIAHKIRLREGPIFGYANVGATGIQHSIAPALPHFVITGVPTDDLYTG